MRTVRLSLVCTLLIALGWVGRAHTQSKPDDSMRAVARQLGAEGIDAYHAGNFADADAKLERAYRLYAAPTLGLYSARSRVRLGRWVEAAERYREATRMSAALSNNDAQLQAQQDAERELAELLPRIPTLTVQIENAESSTVNVTLDGVPLSRDLIGLARPSDVGSHVVIATRGSERIELRVEFGEKDAKVLPLRFREAAHATPALRAASTPLPAAVPSAPPAALRGLGPIAGVALGIGVLGLSTWAVGALIANGKLDNCRDHNGKRICDTKANADTYDTWKTLSTVGFYTGAAFTAVGVGTWLWSLGREQPAPSLSLDIGPAGASLRGRF